MTNKEVNYLDMLEALKMLVNKAEGKEKKELRAKQKEFIKLVKQVTAMNIQSDNAKYASVIEQLEKTNKEIEFAIKDVNRITNVLTTITNTMNTIGEIV